MYRSARRASGRDVCLRRNGRWRPHERHTETGPQTRSSSRRKYISSRRRVALLVHDRPHSRASAETEDVMRVLVLIATVSVVGARPLLAQERLNPDPRGFISGFGGTAKLLGNSTGNVQVQGGVRIAPHLMIFGNLGHFQDVHGDLQPTLDAAVASLS